MCFSRIENLRNKSESVDESKADDAFYTREGEITELEALIPEIEEKIQDAKDMKVQSASNQAEEAGFSKGTYLEAFLSSSYVNCSFFFIEGKLICFKPVKFAVCVKP